MATNDLLKGQSKVRTPGIDLERVRLIGNTLNMAGDNQAENDVAQMLQIYAGQFVHKVWIQVTTAEGSALTVDVGDGADIDGWLDGKNANSAAYSEHYHTSTVFTYDPGSLADGVQELADVVVTGSALGDTVIVSPPYDLQGIMLEGYVRVAGTVETLLQNESTATVDLASSALWRVDVIRSTEAYAVRGGKLYTADDTIDIKTLGAAGSTAVMKIAALVSQPFGNS